MSRDRSRENPDPTKASADADGSAASPRDAATAGIPESVDVLASVETYVEQLRRVHERHAQRASELEVRASELETRETELQARTEAFERDRAAFAGACDEQIAILAQAESDVETERAACAGAQAALDDARQALAADRARFDAWRAELEAELKERESRLAGEARGLMDRRTRIGRMVAALRGREEALELRMQAVEEQLQERIRRLDDEQVILDNRASQLDDRERLLSVGHHQLDERIAQLREERTELDDERASLEADRARLSEAADVANRHLAESREQLGSLEARLQETESARRALEERAQRVEASNEVLEESLAEARTRLADTDAELARSRDALAAAAAPEDLVRLEAERTRLAERADMLEARVAELDARLAAAIDPRAYAALETERDEAQAAAAAASERIVASSADCENARAEVFRLTEALRDAESARTEAVRRIEVLEHTLESGPASPCPVDDDGLETARGDAERAVAEAAAAVERIALLEQWIAAAARQEGRASEHLAAAESARDEALERVRELEEALRTASEAAEGDAHAAELDSVRSDRDAAIAERDELREQVVELRERISDLERRLAESPEAGMDASNGGARIETLQVAVAALEAERDDLQAQVGLLEAALEQAAATAPNAAEDVAGTEAVALRARVAELESERDALASELESAGPPRAEAPSRDDLRSKAARLIEIDRHLECRRDRLRRMRMLVQVERNEAKDEARAAVAAEREHELEVHSARVRHLEQQRLELDQKRSRLAALERRMIRRWACPRAVVTSVLILVLAAASLAGGWFAAGLQHPPVRSVAVTLQARSDREGVLDDAQLEAWRERSVAMLGDRSFHRALADRLGEMRLDHLADADLIGDRLARDLTHSGTQPGRLVLTLAGTDPAEITAVLDALAVTAGAESRRRQSQNPDAAYLVPASERLENGGYRYAEASPVAIVDDRLRHAPVYAGIAFAAVFVLVGAIYLGLLRVKREFDDDGLGLDAPIESFEDVKAA